MIDFGLTMEALIVCQPKKVFVLLGKDEIP